MIFIELQIVFFALVPFVLMAHEVFFPLTVVSLMLSIIFCYSGNNKMCPFSLGLSNK